MKKSYIVKLEIPEGYSARDGADYIREAVQLWCKQFDPKCTSFSIGDGATVKPIKDIKMEDEFFAMGGIRP